MVLSRMMQQDFAVLHSRRIDQLTGRNIIDPKDARYVDVVRELDDVVAGFRSHLLNDEGRRAVFGDAPLNVESSLTVTSRRLTDMAATFYRPSSRFWFDPAIMDEVKAGLADLYRVIYNPDQATFGNWWHWEIGATRALADCLILVAQELTSSEIALYCEALDTFNPDPWFHRGRDASKGANRIDLCRASVVRSILTEDQVRFDRACQGVKATWQIVGEGEGFYSDASFIQHASTPYTGTYGVTLLSGITDIVDLVGTESLWSEEYSVENFCRLVERAFVPLVYRSQMMDCVRGRAISRAEQDGRHDAFSLLESMAVLAGSVPEVISGRWYQFCRSELTDDRSRSGFMDESSIQRISLLDRIDLADSAGYERPNHTVYASMARVVHRSGNYAYSVSMSSRTVGWYECGNGENERGFHQGSGMLSLFDGDTEHWVDAFWPTVDYYRLPGTTVDKALLPNKATGEWGIGKPQNAWAGGLELGECGSAAQEMVGPGEFGAQAKKSWFFIPGLVVCIGSDITGGSGQGVETIVENRLNHYQGQDLIKTDDGLTLDSSPVSLLNKNTTWLNIKNVGGYYFPTKTDVGLSVDRRAGRWSDIHNNGPSDLIERQYATVWIEHNISGHAASYAYAISPGATVEETSALAANPPFEVVHNDASCHAIYVRSNGILLVHCWTAFRIAFNGIEVLMSSPAALSLTLREDEVLCSVFMAPNKATHLTLTTNLLLAEDGVASEFSAVFEEGLTTIVLDASSASGRQVDLVLGYR